MSTHHDSEQQQDGLDGDGGDAENELGRREMMSNAGIGLFGAMALFGDSDSDWSIFGDDEEDQKGLRLLDDGETFVTDATENTELNFADGLEATELDSGAFALKVAGIDDGGDITDTRTDVSNNGSTLVENASDINAGSGLQAVDDGDGTATLSVTSEGLVVATIDDTDSPYTTNGEDRIVCLTGNGSVEVQLASADATAGNSIEVINAEGANAVTVSTEGSETIDPGAESAKAITTAGWTVAFTSDGSNWDASRDAEFESVNTEDLNSTRYADEFGSIQAAINDLPQDSKNIRQGKVVVPDKQEGWQETVTAALHGSILEGYGHNTLIQGDGTTLEINETDVTVQHLWIDNAGTTGHAIYIPSGGQEATLRDLDVDDSPNRGIQIESANSVKLSDVRVYSANIADNGVQLIGATEFQASNLQVTDVSGAGIASDGTGGNSNVQATVKNPGGLGVNWWDPNSVLNLTIKNAGDDGLRLDGDGGGCVVTAAVSGSAGRSLYIDSSDNVVTGRFGGDVELTANASNNTIIGSAAGSLTDSGTGNDTSNLN